MDLTATTVIALLTPTGCADCGYRFGPYSKVFAAGKLSRCGHCHVQAQVAAQAP